MNRPTLTVAGQASEVVASDGSVDHVLLDGVYA